MSRSICFLMFCLCILPVTAYSTEEPHKEYQITIGKLQCLYEHTERLLDSLESSFTVLLSEQCEDIAIKVGDSGVTRGSKDEEISSEIKLASHQVNSDIVDVLILTHEELKCFREKFENLEPEKKVNSEELLLIHFNASCKK